MTEKGKALFEERYKLYQQAFMWKKPKRVLYNANLYSWAVWDMGYTPSEAANDYDLNMKISIDSAEKYGYDILNVSGSPLRFNTLMFDSLGGSKRWEVNSKGDFNVHDADTLGPEDYDLLKENPSKALWEKALFKNYPKAAYYTPQQFAEAVKTAQNNTNANAEIKKVLREECGVLVETAPLVVQPFIEKISNTYRGFKGLSLDLRRCPEKVYEVCEYQDNLTMEVMKKKFDGLPYGPSGFNYFDTKCAYTTNTMLSAKNLEKLLLEPTAKMLEYHNEHGLLFFIQCEGSFDRFTDFLNEWPKGLINIVVEVDDPFAIRKKCPVLCLSGGLSVDVMGHETPEKAVDAAKKAIDELGTSDGGLVLTTNKMVSYDYDMKSDTLKAVCDFVRDYNVN